MASRSYTHTWAVFHFNGETFAESLHFAGMADTCCSRHPDSKRLMGCSELLSDSTFFGDAPAFGVTDAVDFPVSNRHEWACL